MAEQKKNPEEKKSSKKLIIIIAVVVVLLFGGGGAGYYFFMHKADDAAAEDKEAKHGEGDKKSETKKAEAEHEVEAEHEAEAEEEGGEEGAKGPVYYDLVQPMIVNFPKGSGASLVQISVSFLADSEASSVALKKHEPMVRNNLMMKINAQSPEVLKSKEGKDALRKIMLDEVNVILDKMAHGKHVKEVFFTIFVMQ